MLDLDRQEPFISTSSTANAAKPRLVKRRQTLDQNRRFIEQSNRFEASGPESSGRTVLVIGSSGDFLAQASHEPRQAGEASARSSATRSVLAVFASYKAKLVVTAELTAQG